MARVMNDIALKMRYARYQRQMKLLEKRLDAAIKQNNRREKAQVEKLMDELDKRLENGTERN